MRDQLEASSSASHQLSPLTDGPMSSVIDIAADINTENISLAQTVAVDSKADFEKHSVVEEYDITDHNIWDPLQRPSNDIAAMDKSYETKVADEIGRPVSSNSGHMESRRPSRIQLEVKHSPQPWELMDPPDSNGYGRAEEGKSEAFDTIGSRKFSAMQSSGPSLIPKSSYYFGPPPSTAAYGTNPVGQIGVHYPREIVRIERDYTGGELIQFAPIYPLELEGRLTPTQFLESINSINEVLISAHDVRHTFWDNFLAVASLQVSRMVGVRTHYDKEMGKLQALIRDLNTELYNPMGLNILWPRNVAFLFLEIEYY